MERRQTDKAKGGENNFKKALLTRYLEDQVLYNLNVPTDDTYQSSVLNEGGKGKSGSTNDVIVKINDQLTSPEPQNQILHKREMRRLSIGPNLNHDINGNQVLAESHSKLSKSLDEGQFKSLYHEITNHNETQANNGRTMKRSDLTRPQLKFRKYSDCSNYRTQNYENPSIGRQNASYEYTVDLHNHRTNTLARGIKKAPFPVLGVNERFAGRRQASFSSNLDGSIQDINHFRDNEMLRASMSSFKSSCSSFPGVEFDDSDYDRSCTSSPCSPLNITCRLPPIYSEINN